MANKKKNYHFLKDLLMVLIFPFWLIIHPALMFGASLCPGFANKGLYQKSELYGKKVKKHFLIGKRSSRFSFTFANGLLHFLIFLISIIITWWFYKSYLNPSLTVTYKNLNIEIDRYTPNGHVQIDSTTSMELNSFHLLWANGDTMKMKKVFPSSKTDYLSLSFKPKQNKLDTTFYKITIHADFDLKIDTAVLRRNLQGRVNSRLFDYEIEKYGNDEGIYYIVLNLMNLPEKDQTGTCDRWFEILTSNELYDDDSSPYLNYCISFWFNDDVLNVNNISPERLINNDFLLMFSYWRSLSHAQVVPSRLPYYNVPCELIDAKPEPIKQQFPYQLYYKGESFKDAIQNGVFLKFVNRDLLQQKDHDAFFNSVIFGALITFILTVLIELLTKWRNLNLRSGNKDPYSDN